MLCRAVEGNAPKDAEQIGRRDQPLTTIGIAASKYKGAATP
jgi:hypothetical protein